MSEDLVAVVVDYHAGEVLTRCVESLRANGVSVVVVVENGEPGSVPPAARAAGARVVSPGVNLGYGGGVNRGVAWAPSSTYLLVSNPDVVVHDGAVGELVRYLEGHPSVALAGPRILSRDGSTYPSARVFPNVWLAGLHALAAPWWPQNPATRRYRSPHPDGSPDWVSGAFFVVRRIAFERAGGFDERYFMFAEDMALCWELRQLGYEVAYVDEAVVTHDEGVSRALAPRSMRVAHHTSALRFEWHTARGFRRALAPVAVLVLAVRLVASTLAHPRRVD